MSGAVPFSNSAAGGGTLPWRGAPVRIGRQTAIQRRQLRGPNRQLPNNRQPGGSPQQNRGSGSQSRGKTVRPERGGFREKLRKLNPFAPKKKELVRLGRSSLLAFGASICAAD